MAEYIEREALLKDVAKIGGFPWSEWETAGVFNVITKQPIADVVPVVHGRWKRMKAYHTEYVCSECGDIWPDFRSDYCPSCGARMEEV